MRVLAYPSPSPPSTLTSRQRFKCHIKRKKAKAERVTCHELLRGAGVETPG